MNAEKQALLDLIAEAEVQDFAALLRVAYARRYTGAITFHFLAGTACSAEFASDPVRVRLDQTPRVARSA